MKLLFNPNAKVLVLRLDSKFYNLTTCEETNGIDCRTYIFMRKCFKTKRIKTNLQNFLHNISKYADNLMLVIDRQDNKEYLLSDINLTIITTKDTVQLQGNINKKALDNILNLFKWKNY